MISAGKGSVESWNSVVPRALVLSRKNQKPCIIETHWVQVDLDYTSGRLRKGKRSHSGVLDLAETIENNQVENGTFQAWHSALCSTKTPPR